MGATILPQSKIYTGKENRQIQQPQLVHMYELEEIRDKEIRKQPQKNEGAIDLRNTRGHIPNGGVSYFHNLIALGNTQAKKAYLIK